MSNTVDTHLIKFTDAEGVTHYWHGRGWAEDIERAKLYSNERARAAFKVMTHAMDRTNPLYARMAVAPDPRWLAKREADRLASVWGVITVVPGDDGPTRYYWTGRAWNLNACEAERFDERVEARQAADAIRADRERHAPLYRINTHTTILNEDEL